MPNGHRSFTGKTQNLGVIGNPVAHSLSPAMQNAAIEESGLDYAYLAFPVAEQDLADAVEGLRCLGFRGFNVTIPHKSAIIPLLDAIDDDARIIGAVNTVVHDGGKLMGYNTDAQGFMDALRAQGFSPEGKTAALLGAGGAARAVIWGLAKAHIAGIRIGVRNVPKARTLVEEFRHHGVGIDLFHWEDGLFQEKLAEVDLLVNTTPLGMTPKVDGMPPVQWEHLTPGAWVYDIIYTPAKTRLLRTAEAKGHPVLNGEGMLVGQGAAAFKLWTGQEADRGAMAEALRAALEKQQN